MDNLTHSLTGLAMARCGASEISPRAMLLLLLSANAPDIDVVAAPWGALRYLEIHRGYTHCLLALPLMAALSVLATAAIYRQRLPWLRAWFLCCLGVASHLLLDWTNSYGVRLFLPFSSRWAHLDINSLTDGIILLVLLLAAVWPWFAGLVSWEIGSRQRPHVRATSVAALAFFTLFDLGRLLLHGWAIAQLNSRIYDGAVPRKVAALPTTFNPFLWTGIAETDESFAEIDVPALHELDPDTATIVHKQRFDSAIDAARKSEPFRYFQYFARFPVWTQEPVTLPNEPAVRVELTDLRFGSPGDGSFHCVALVDRTGKVIESVFTFGSGASIGRPGG
jgi:inner membrane protein